MTPAVFTNDELIELSLALREVREIDDYCLHINGIFEEIFSLDGGLSYCYHFFDGHMHTAGMPSDIREKWPDLATRIQFYQPDAWRESGEPFMHSAIYAERFPEVSADLEEMLALFKDRGEFMLGTWAFENHFMMATAGVARPFSAGDFTEADLLKFKLLVPFWKDGMLESARYTRAKMLGGDFAALIENHPSALFLFDGNDRFVYGNYQAKMLLQTEPRASTGVAYANASEIPRTLVSRKFEGNAVLPFGKMAVIMQLPDWPELGLRKPWLAVVPEQAAELPLSEREVEVLRAYAQTDGADAGATKLGTAVTTYRTHLKNIAQKLGVSGSNAALTMFYLSGAYKGPQAV